MNLKGTKKKNQVVNIFEQQEIIAKADVIKNNLKAFTWHELETKGKFDKNGRDHKFGGNRYGKKGGFKSREKSPENTIYGKPKDKHNVTSFGTFIGNSQKND